MAQLIFTENASDPTSPSAGQLSLFAKTDDELYVKTSAGVVYALTGTSAITSLSGDVVASGPGGAVATIQPNVVTNAKLAQMATHTIKGNNTGSAANAADLTATQVTAMLNLFSSSLQGLVPASGGGTTNFLRADGAWAVAGSGSVTSVALSDGSTIPIYSISGSPVTSTGTLTFTLSNQNANLVFAGPATGSAAQPTFRSLVASDIPSLSGIYLPLSGGNLTGNLGLAGGSVGSPSLHFATDTTSGFYRPGVDQINIGILGAPVVNIGTSGVAITGNVSATNLSGTNTGDVTLAPVGASPNANAASLSGQALTLEPFSSAFPGVVSASGGGTTNFLRADGTWSAPPTSPPGGSNTQVQFNNSGSFGGSPLFAWDGSQVLIAGAGENTGGGLANLQLTNTSSETGIDLNNTGTGGRSYNIVSANSGSAVGAGNFSILDATASVARLTINSSGNVGIGNTNPQARLHITGGGVQIGDPGNDQNLTFGGTNSGIYWAASGANIYYSVGSLIFSPVGAPNAFTLQASTGNGIFTGALSASNLSGTNTGDVTLTGENYLTIAGQVITVHPVNLATSNVTGILPGSHVGAGGTPTQMQFNDGGVLGGLGLSAVDNASFFMGLQQATPIAPLHVTGASGVTVAAPASLTSVLVLDPTVTSPTTYTVAQVNSPAAPVITATNLNYIDNPNAGSGVQNTGSGPYICNGQVITYNLYTYLLVGGVRVATGNYYTMTVQDFINDGVTQFYVDLSGFGTGGASFDGYILWKQDNQGYGPYWIDLPGAPTGYTDNGYTNQDAYIVSPYQATGLTWSSGISQYQSIDGTNYTGNYSTNPAGDDSSGRYFYINTTWTVVGLDTYMAVSDIASNHYDLGNTGTFDDYNQSGIPPYTPFASIAFAYFPTGISDGSEVSVTPNESEGGSYNFNGSTYQYNVYEYNTNPVNGIQYCTSGYSFSTGDPNDGSTTGAFDIILNAGTGQGRIITVSVNGGPIVGVDMGGATTITDYGTWGAAPNTSHLISSYAGYQRYFSAYGFVTSPSTKYSATHNDQSFIDNNPVDGYVINHFVSGFGSATNVKIVGTTTLGGTPFTHVIPNASADPSYILQGAASTDGNITVTPATLGFLATGQTITYQAWSTELSGGVTIYSGTFASHSQVFPNDGLYYVVNLTIGAVGGATYKLEKVGTGYMLSATTSFQDNNSVPWNASSTVTPTSGYITGAIIERGFVGTPGEPGCAQFKSTSVYSPYNQFFSNGSEIARYGMEAGGNFFIAPNGQYGLEIGTQGNPHTIIAGANGQSTIFNNLAQTNSPFIIKGANNEIVHTDPFYNTFFLGNHGALSSNPNAQLSIIPWNSNLAINAIQPGAASPLNVAIQVTDSTNGQAFGVSWGGRAWFAFGGNKTTSNLSIGQGQNSLDQIHLDNSSTPPPLASNDSPGGINRYDNNGYVPNANAIGTQLLFTDKNSHTYAILTNVDPATGGSGNNSCFWRTGTNGMPVPDTGFFTNSTHTLYIFSGAQVEFKQGASIDNSQFLGIGNALTIGASSGPSSNPGFSGHMTFGISNASTQRVGFFGTVPIAQQANTVAIDTNLINQGLLAAGTIAKFDTDVKIGVVGKGLYIKEGTNATMGVATLVAGTVVVSTTKVTASSRIFLTAQSLGTITVPAALAVSARTAGTSFTILSSNLTDTSVVAWQIIEPA